MDTNNNSNKYYSLRSGGRTSSAKNNNSMSMSMIAPSCEDEDDRDVGGSGNDRSNIGNDEDPPLSEYELLRLRNIQRNEARLLALGLIHNVPTTTKRGEEQTKSSSNSDKENQRKKNDTINDDAKSLIPLRNLPKRSCAARRTSSDTENDIDDNNVFESPPPSPIQPKRVLTLQPHQMEVDEAESHLPVYKRTRRERRGRPRLEDYSYICEEVCSHCGGEWKLNGDNDEEEEEETRLFRCKDCRGAFHMQCMLVHGKSDDDEAKEGGEDDVASGGGEKVEELQKEDERNEDDIVPKRCFQCECNKEKRRNIFVPMLDAVIADKEVSVRITPQPSLEAIVNEKNVTCYIMFNNEQ